MGSAGSAATVVRTLTPRTDRMRAAASGLLLATDVADYLVAKGVPFRTAHEITGRIVRDLYQSQKDFAALTPAEWRTYHASFGDDVKSVITPEAAIAGKRTPQSTRPEAVARALADVKQWLSKPTA